MALSHPLISTIFTLYTLIILYFPTIIHLSPILISTSILLLFLLKLGADQRNLEEPKKEPGPEPETETETSSVQFPNNVAYHDDDDCINSKMDSMVDPDPKPDPDTANPSLLVLKDCTSCERHMAIDPDIDCGAESGCETDSKTGSDTNCFIESDRKKNSAVDPSPETRPFYGNCFMEWNVRAPFEVIYNDYLTNCEMDSVFDPGMKPDPVSECFNEYIVHSGCEKDPVFDPDPDHDLNSRPYYGDCFVEWNVRAPLEVIYEAYEGEEEEDTDGKREEELWVIDKYASLSMYKQQQRQTQCNLSLSTYKQQSRCNTSLYKPQQRAKCDAPLSFYKQQQQQTQCDVSLSMYYPDTDTDSSSSDGDSPVIRESPKKFCFRWDEEDKEGLIEIELDCKRNSEVEEENLIEIDLSPEPWINR